MSKRFVKAVKATKRLEFHELLALSVLIKGQLSEFTCDCEEYEQEDSVEVQLDKPLVHAEKEKDYDLDDQDPSIPTPTKKQLDIDLLRYRLKDPRLTKEEKQQIRKEIISVFHQHDEDE